MPPKAPVAVGCLLVSTLVAAVLAFAQVPSGPRGGLTGFAKRFEEIKASSSREELYRFLWALPKGGDLHNHHEYSVPVEDWFALASKSKAYYSRIKVSNCGTEEGERLQYMTIRRSSYQKLTPCLQGDYRPLESFDQQQRAGWVSALKLDRPGEGRDEFFERIVPLLGELENDADLMSELLVHQLKQSSEEGVRYIETQADPRHFLAPDDSKLNWTDGASWYRRRLVRSDALATGVSARFEVSVLRFTDHAEKSLGEAYEFVHQNRDLWVSVNLVGREDNPKGGAPRFLETFRDLRKRYFDIPLTIHGGESESPGRQVRDTLFLGASRIGHGTNLVTDPDTMLLLRGGRYLVEVSLVSNQMLEYTPDVSKHPFPEYLRLGVPVCLNTDDRGALDSNMIDEYFLAVTNFNLSWAEIVQIGRQSLEYSFAEPPLKQRLLKDYDRDVAAFERKYNVAGWKQLLNEVKAKHSGFSRRSLGFS